MKFLLGAIMNEDVVTFFVCVVSSIMILTIFFTVRKALLNKFSKSEEVIKVTFFKNFNNDVNIYLKDGKIIENVKIEGIIKNQENIPYELQNFVCVVGENGLRKYIKAKLIRQIEEIQINTKN